MTTPTCAVVICSHSDHRLQDVLAAVNSVTAQQPAPYEVIVVVDHNPILQARLTRRLRDVSVVANHHPRGLSGARNTGAEHTTAEVVAFLDDDDIAQPGWLAGLAEQYTDATVLGVGGRIEPGWESGRPAWWPVEFDWVVDCTYTGQDAGVVGDLSGDNASFRRELFAGGGFATGLDGSATEFCTRATKTQPAGVFVQTDRAAVRHRIPAARQTFAYFRSRCYAEGLAKAAGAGSAGLRAAPAAGWSYPAVILPAGVLRRLCRVAPADRAALMSAAAMLVGMAYTAAGFLAGATGARGAHGVMAA